MKKDKKLLIEVALGLLAITVTILVAQGFFNSPVILKVIQSGSDNTCPDRLWEYFKVTFGNEGNKGTNVCVMISSQDKNVTFIKNESCLFIGKDEQTAFELHLNDSSISKENNINIIYQYKYKAMFSIQTHTVSCQYEREYAWDNLKLKSEEDLN